MADRARASMGERIAARIAQRGPIPVSEYVEACLYGPDGGFYMGGGRSGRRTGHFLTAPEVGPLFGAVLARALDAWWAELDEPEPFTVIDWGAGPGTLARSVLAAEPRCMSAGALQWLAVELSRVQRALHPDHPIVTSTARVAEALPEGAASGVVVANELLDNLPFDVVVRTEDGWDELRVDAGGRAPKIGAGGGPSFSLGAGGGPSFSLVAVPAATELVEGLPDVAAGARVPVQRAARRWLAEAHGVLRAGRIVVFDYGADTATLAERAPETEDPATGLGWLRTHRQHLSGSPWLAEPGFSDITVDVALDQIQASRRAEVRSQAEFLRAHGIGELVTDGQAVWSERAAVGDLEALRARSRSSEARALLDPSGMGAFRVLIWTVGG